MITILTLWCTVVCNTEYSTQTQQVYKVEKALKMKKGVGMVHVLAEKVMKQGIEM